MGLRDEMYENFDKQTKNLKAEENSRIEDIKKATAREDDLQKQIDATNAAREAKRKGDYDKG